MTRRGGVAGAPTATRVVGATPAAGPAAGGYSPNGAIPGPVLITGAGGFLGATLIARLAGDDPEREILATDLAMHPRLESLGSIPGMTFEAGDLADRGFCERLVNTRPATIYHLASLVSGGAERDFEAGMQANVHGFMNLLEAARRSGFTPRVIFPSSIATFGGPDLPEEIDDRTAQHPQNSYGIAKVIGEQLLHDYTRKGYIDGRGIRLAAIAVRDEANSAASGYASSIVREPLAGHDYVSPVSAETRIPIMPVDRCLESLVYLGGCDGALFGAGWRTINGPSFSPSAGELALAVKRAAREAGVKVGSISFAADPDVEAIVSAWPRRMDATRARAIGLPDAGSADALVADYINRRPGLRKPQR